MPSSILLIDDDQVLRRVMTAALAEYSVAESASGEEGLAAFSSNSYDLVICDLILPGIGGFEVIRKMRQLRPAQRVMVVSSFGTEENLLTALRENVVDFLVKPFSPSQLQSAVRNLLRSDAAIEVVSATRQWIEVRIPASFQVAESLDAFFTALPSDLDGETRHVIAAAFRELVNNAIEHGCRGDPDGLVSVSCVRMKRGILYRIKDPGWGFDFESIPHAAIANPENDSLRHVQYRQDKGLRPGGYGLVFLRNFADELIYNENGNEVIFVKYL